MAVLRGVRCILALREKGDIIGAVKTRFGQPLRSVFVFVPNPGNSKFAKKQAAATGSGNIGMEPLIQESDSTSLGSKSGEVEFEEELEEPPASLAASVNISPQLSFFPKRTQKVCSIFGGLNKKNRGKTTLERIRDTFPAFVCGFAAVLPSVCSSNFRLSFVVTRRRQN